jgi:hypothetical protein
LKKLLSYPGIELEVSSFFGGAIAASILGLFKRFSYFPILEDYLVISYSLPDNIWKDLKEI